MQKNTSFLLELVGVCKGWVWVLFNLTQPQLEKSPTYLIQPIIYSSKNQPNPTHKGHVRLDCVIELG